MIPMETTHERLLRAEVVNVQGDVSVQTKGSQEAVKLLHGTVLHAGDVIKTGQGSCLLLINGKTKVALTPLTTLKISNESLLDLLDGNIMVKLAKLKKGSTFEVKTPTAVATVRGTTLYLQTGNGIAKLYVDETHGGVVWKNIFSGNSVLVPAFSLSGAFANGQVDDPVQLTPEQKEAFFKEWQGAGGSNLSQQFGIEEITTLPSPGSNTNLPDLQNIPDLNDALLDKLIEQNIAGSNGFIPPLPSPETSAPTEEELAQQERDMIHRELAALMGDQAFDSADAQQARIADAQTGKVFTDVHGNRVRVDQYISQPTPETVEFLSLTARTGAYQTGVSAILFETIFNRPIDLGQDGALKDLPWHDYLRIITRNDLNGGDVPTLFEQFIVHEHYGNAETGPDLYPEIFIVTFNAPFQPSATATRGSLAFGEFYSEPFHVDAAQGSFWVQGMAAEAMSLLQMTGETITLDIELGTLFSSNSEGPIITRISTINGENVIFGHSNGSQTAGLPTDSRISDLMTASGVNYFRTNGEVHPAYFEDSGGGNILVGMFFPIDDEGNIFDAPGFDLNGIRDLLFPNPLVNGGNYNLELLFVFGQGDETNFTESFRIDTIITPEIFGRHEIIGQPGVFHPGYGLKNPDGSLDTSTVFDSDSE